MERYPLPGRRINVVDTSYIVHGLVHDNPFISISPEFKKIINESFRGYSVICEDGFTDWIDNSVSFWEIKYFGLDKINFFEVIKILLAMGYAKFIPKRKSSILQQVQEMKSFENLENIRENLFRTYLPEPQGMNSLLARLGSGTLENPKEELPLRIKRYLYEAKKSVEYTKSNNIDELHIVVGCAHELPLEYLLQNQRLLDRFKFEES